VNSAGALQESDMRSRKKPGKQKSESRRVSRAIETALTRIEECDPNLGDVLRESIETGEFFSYSPKQRARRHKTEK